VSIFGRFAGRKWCQVVVWRYRVSIFGRFEVPHRSDDGASDPRTDGIHIIIPIVNPFI
jgi:hypothetical protein